MKTFADFTIKLKMNAQAYAKLTDADLEPLCSKADELRDILQEVAKTWLEENAPQLVVSVEN